MPEIMFECEVSAGIERVWAWHDRVAEALALLAPPGDAVRIESLSPSVPAEGFEVVITANGLLPIMKRIRWVARYVEYVPPHAVITGMEARFVDEQVTGPFAYWRHSHEFEALGDNRTRITDRITYRPPLWPLSWPGDLLIARPKLRAMFAHRHRVMWGLFGK